jgi:hypothetical protein
MASVATLPIYYSWSLPHLIESICATVYWNESDTQPSAQGAKEVYGKKRSAVRKAFDAYNEGLDSAKLPALKKALDEFLQKLPNGKETAVQIGINILKLKVQAALEAVKVVQATGSGSSAPDALSALPPPASALQAVDRQIKVWNDAVDKFLDGKLQLTPNKDASPQEKKAEEERFKNLKKFVGGKWARYRIAQDIVSKKEYLDDILNELSREENTTSFVGDSNVYGIIYNIRKETGELLSLMRYPNENNPSRTVGPPAPPRNESIASSAFDAISGAFSGTVETVKGAVGTIASVVGTAAGNAGDVILSILPPPKTDESEASVPPPSHPPPPRRRSSSVEASGVVSSSHAAHPALRFVPSSSGSRSFHRIADEVVAVAGGKRARRSTLPRAAAGRPRSRSRSSSRSRTAAGHKKVRQVAGGSAMTELAAGSSKTSRRAASSSRKSSHESARDGSRRSPRLAKARSKL